MPRSWYLLVRVAQGFAAGRPIGMLWALWVIRRPRPAQVREVAG